MSGTRCAVLLRGVNVGASNRIAMADFRLLLEDIGCSDVQTYLQSGNAAVTWDGSPAKLAAAVVDALPLAVSVLVRTGSELEHVVQANPFADEDLDPIQLHAVFLSGRPPELDLESLLPDRLVAGERVLYVAYARGSHGTKAAALLSSKRFPVVASARNWRTVLALQELCRG